MYLIEEDRTRELGVGHFLHFRNQTSEILTGDFGP